jgi:hypothetical protein
LGHLPEITFQVGFKKLVESVLSTENLQGFYFLFGEVVFCPFENCNDVV